MRTDKTTKCLLAVIAIALCMLAIHPWLHPVPVSAQDKDDVREVESQLSSIQSLLVSLEIAGQDFRALRTGSAY